MVPRLDYCNGLLVATSENNFSKLQSLQNCAACLAARPRTTRGHPLYNYPRLEGAALVAGQPTGIVPAVRSRLAACGEERVPSAADSGADSRFTAASGLLWHEWHEGKWDM